jgi:hypothetical protein
LSQLSIAFEDGAAAYLAVHGASVTVWGSIRHGCCGGSVAVPTAEPGPPSADAQGGGSPAASGATAAAGERVSHGFEILEHEGVRVFVARDLARHATGTIHIGLDGFARWRRLRVEGVETWSP